MYKNQTDEAEKRRRSFFSASAGRCEPHKENSCNMGCRGRRKNAPMQANASKWQGMIVPVKEDRPIADD
jgi:hypothetical protein